MHAHKMVVDDIEEALIGDGRVAPLVQVLLERLQLDDPAARIEGHVQRAEVRLIMLREMSP
jgi:hypothetical protein